LECGKREAEDIGGIVRIVGERNSVKGKELMLMWLKIEGFAAIVESSIPNKLLMVCCKAALLCSKQSAKG
jgi:hypothetical protein